MSEWYPEGAWIGLFTYPSGRSAANTVFNGLSTWDFRDLRFHPFQTCESMKARSMDKKSGMAYWISLGIFYIFWDAPPLFSRLKWIQEKTRLGAYTSHFLYVTGSHERCTNNAPLPGKLAVSPRWDPPGLSRPVFRLKLPDFLDPWRWPMFDLVGMVDSYP